MVLAMVLAGLRRCEVLGLRIDDVRTGDGRLFIAEGKGGHQRVVPVAGGSSQALGGYLQDERPGAAATAGCSWSLKGPRRGVPLSAEGLDEILAGARRRAGLEHATCHELRHTCLTRLREAGMALEAVQAQAGHRCIESTRIYLHLTNDWLADEYQPGRRADRRRPKGRDRHDRSPGNGRPVSASPARARADGRAPAGTAAAADGSRSAGQHRRWLPRCAVTWRRRPRSWHRAAWLPPTARCGSWPAGCWPAPASGQPPGSDAMTSRTSRYGWPASRHQRHAVG